MAYTPLGRIRPVHKGEWSASTAYIALDMVHSNNVSYIANKDVPAGTPLNNGEYWAVVLDVSDVITDVYEAAGSANQAAANANNVMDVKANALSATAAGNPVQFFPDEHSVIKPVLTLLPIQSGSGDPYPAGCGRNLLGGFTDASVNGVTFTVNTDGSVSVNGTSAYQTNINATIHLKPGTYTLSGCPKGGSSANVAGGYALYTRIANAHYKWDTGEGVAFTLDNEETLDFSIIVRGGTTINAIFYPQLEVGSTATPYTPCSNIRPITGRTGAVLTRCGKNLLPKLEPQSNSLNGLSYTIDDDGVMTVTGTTTANVNIPIHGTYAAVENVFPGLRAKELFALNVTVRITNPETETNRYQGGAITLVDDEFISYVYMTWPSGSTYSSQKYYPSITLGHAAPAYEPYRSSTTYTLDFGQTVYGGKVDWNKGEMVVDRGYVAFNGTEPFGDGGDVWYLNASYAPGIELGFLNANPNAKAYCSHFAQGNGGINDPNSVGKFDLGGSIRFNKSGFATVDAWKAYLAAQHAAGTPVQIAYKLANPITIQLTPQQITALAGANTVYGDADEITVHYNKSLNAAFEELKNAILAMGGNV